MFILIYVNFDGSVGSELFATKEEATRVARIGLRNKDVKSRRIEWTENGHLETEYIV